MKFGLQLALGLLGTAKALSVDDIFAHGQPRATSDDSMSLASVAGALANMANQAPGASSSTVQSIKDYISQMLADITTQHNIAQAELTDVSGYTSCDSKMQAAMGKITTLAPTTTMLTTTILTTTVAPTSAELEACLAEIQNINSSIVSCEYEASAAKAASDAVCANFHFQTVAEAKAARCNDTFAGTYEQYLERDIHVLAEYVAKKQNCSNFTALTESTTSKCTGLRSSLTDKQLECSKIVVVTTTPAGTTTTQQGQTAEEKALCENYHEKVETCSDYDSCYESVDFAKQAERDGASTLEASRTTEWIALKRMLCLVDVIGSTNQTVAIQACMAKQVNDYDTSHLALVLPAAPNKQACGPFTKPASCSVIQPGFSISLQGLQFPR